QSETRQISDFHLPVSQRMYRVDVSLQIKTRLRVSVAIDTLNTVNRFDNIVISGPSRDLAEDVPDQSVLSGARAVAWNNGNHACAIFRIAQRPRICPIERRIARGIELLQSGSSHWLAGKPNPH